jgi:hypothetical protein
MFDNKGQNAIDKFHETNSPGSLGKENSRKEKLNQIEQMRKKVNAKKKNPRK